LLNGISAEGSDLVSIYDTAGEAEQEGQISRFNLLLQVDARGCTRRAKQSLLPAVLLQAAAR